MSQRCGRRCDGETCTYRATFEVVASSTDEAPAGVGLCDGCGSLLRRKGLAELIELERS